MVKICGACQQPLIQKVGDEFALIKIKACKHYAHEDCFAHGKFSKIDQHIKTINCPECKVEVVQAHKNDVNEKLKGRIFRVDLSFTEAKKPVQWIAGASIAVAIMVLALAIYPSVAGGCIGAMAAGYLGYKSAHFVGRYFAFPEELLGKMS